LFSVLFLYIFFISISYSFLTPSAKLKYILAFPSSISSFNATSKLLFSSIPNSVVVVKFPYIPNFVFWSIFPIIFPEFIAPLISPGFPFSPFFIFIIVLVVISPLSSVISLSVSLSTIPCPNVATFPVSGS